MYEVKAQPVTDTLELIDDFGARTSFVALARAARQATKSAFAAITSKPSQFWRPKIWNALTLAEMTACVTTVRFNRN